MVLHFLISLISVAPEVSAQSARLKFTADGRCESYLLRQEDQPEQKLDPAAVFIDLARKRILFSVPRSSAGHLSAVPNVELSGTTASAEWNFEVNAANEINLRAAPPGNIWIDATEEVPLAERLFATYEWHGVDARNVTKDNCFGATAKLLGVSVKKPDFFDERDYFAAGFCEIDAPAFSQVTLGAIYTIESSGFIIPHHSFLPIVGTSWAIDKMGTGALLIKPIEEILKFYKDFAVSQQRGFAYQYLVRGFLKPSNRSPLLDLQRENPSWLRNIEAAKARERSFLAALEHKFQITKAKRQFHAYPTSKEVFALRHGTINFPLAEGGSVTREFSLDLRDPLDPIILIELRDPREGWLYTQMIYETFVLNVSRQGASSLNAEDGLMPIQASTGPWIDAFALSQAQIIHHKEKVELKISALPHLTYRLGYSGIPPYFENLITGMRDYLSLRPLPE